MNRAVFLLFAVVVAVYPLHAQEQLSTRSKKAIALYKEADNYRVRGQHQQAIQLLDEAIGRDKNFAEAYYRRGLVHFTRKNYDLAIADFEKGLSLTREPARQKVYWYDLGEAYLATGNYEKAGEMLKKFVAAEKRNQPKLNRAMTMLKSVEFASTARLAKSNYRQRQLSDTVNAFPLQYFPVLTADQQELIFTRRLGTSGDDDEDLVVSRKDAQGRWQAPVSISENINSQWNEGTCTISADGRKLIFTSCLGRPGYGSCDLFQSEKIGDTWTKPKNLGPNVNTADWESQPSLSADGRTLYFVSDRSGGYGRRDIWVTHLDENNEWTKAVNAGRSVNTQFDEISPFIHANNRTLYFASNGLPGYGGYDIYYVEKTGSGWSAPKNLEAPINDHEDQFSLYITADGTKGYYVHEDADASSRIMEVIIPEEDRLRFRSNYVEGIVTDRQTGKPLAADIELVDINTNQPESVVVSDSVTGEYLIVLTQGSEYALYVSKKGYLFQSLNFNYSEVEDFEPIVLNIQLDRAEAGSVSVLKNLFFDTDRYDLKEKSRTELHKIIRFLQDNPEIRVEIGGHTDNVGSDPYNRQLSERRAQAVFAYLSNNGVDPARLKTKGYGPDRPVGDNATEEGRQLNRRIEFRILP
ncbi:MAG: OmpA family protein [Cyclobacteriaceae bacterium]|jgi:outer membrane protein OmpA-like peptidoglycan-associated protein/Tfp pilus assembly protein PilF|nr:OmpA family protein [Cyclobacteriaceae bacterium]